MPAKLDKKSETSGDVCNKFAFAAAQNSPQIQQKDCGAFFGQFWACSGNALQHSRIRRTMRRVCNAQGAESSLFDHPRDALHHQKGFFWLPTPYIPAANSIYIGGQLHIYRGLTPYILAAHSIYTGRQLHIYWCRTMFQRGALRSRMKFLFVTFFYQEYDICILQILFLTTKNFRHFSCQHPIIYLPAAGSRPYTLSSSRRLLFSEFLYCDGVMPVTALNCALR